MDMTDIIIGDRADAAGLEFIEAQINEYNFATTGIRDARLRVAVLRDPDGRIYAGLGGHTWAGVVDVRLLWVHESRRHIGIGSRLLSAAEAKRAFRRPLFFEKRLI